MNVNYPRQPSSYGRTDTDNAKKERASPEKCSKKSLNKTLAVNSCFLRATYRGPGVPKSLRYPLT